MDKIRVLQLGSEDWNERYVIPDSVELVYSECFEEAPEKAFDLVFWDREPGGEELDALYKSTKAHTLFVPSDIRLMRDARTLYTSKVGKLIGREDIQRFLTEETRFFYTKGYGEKFNPANLAISDSFQGTVRWNGKYCVDLEGDFGEDFCQVAYWRSNIPIFAHQMIDLWLEYKKTPGVEIALAVTQIAAGAISDMTSRRIFSEEELREVVSIEGGEKEERFFVSLSARGSGRLQIIALHDRYSRGSHGWFLPGGERYVTSEREEAFCYFDPMDGKPPLNVYYSGYKTAQGFEGYNLMRSLGCPFLLIAEPRLDGGCFYKGSEEYEKQLLDIVTEHKNKLGFSYDQVILSGISMGTFGAMYYGCDLSPYALILGKPLASLGNVAANEKLARPSGFPTSLDVVHYLYGDTDESSVSKLNEIFWKKFDDAIWSWTKIIVSYMIEDDYDNTAYDTLLEHLRADGVKVYGKGIHGRHNDNTGGIVNWFSSQFKQILREDFGRKFE